MMSDYVVWCLPYRPATGLSIAVVSHESAVPDEISFQNGDKIEIIGYFLKCMPWFVGRHLSSGQVGFVQSSCVEPEGSLAMATEWVPLESRNTFQVSGQVRQKRSFLTCVGDKEADLLATIWVLFPASRKTGDGTPRGAHKTTTTELKIIMLLSSHLPFPPTFQTALWLLLFLTFW